MVFVRKVELYIGLIVLSYTYTFHEAVIVDISTLLLQIKLDPVVEANGTVSTCLSSEHMFEGT